MKSILGETSAGQILNGTMMWIAGLALAGVSAFFNLSSSVAVVSERETNHYAEIQKQLASVSATLGSTNEKLDALLTDRGIKIKK